MSMAKRGNSKANSLRGDVAEIKHAPPGLIHRFVSAPRVAIRKQRYIQAVDDLGAKYSHPGKNFLAHRGNVLLSQTF